MTDAGPEYRNQQLRSVSLETFFPGQFSVYTGLADVQREVRERMPHLFVPNAQPGMATALRANQFKSQDQREALAVALNQATYVSYDYPGHVAFIDDAVGLLARTLELLRIDELNRVVYRYENEIGIGREENDLLPLNRILRMPSTEWCGFDALLGVDLNWNRAWEGGHLLTRLSVEEEPGTAPVLKLILAAQVSPAGSVERLRSFAEAAHSVARKCFDSMITDDFRAVLRGDGDENEDEDGNGGNDVG